MFKSIHGHANVKNGLLQLAGSGRIPHASLFMAQEGSNGLGMALAYAQYICCTDKQESDSCGVCSSCRKCSNYTHPDVHLSFPIHGKENCDQYTPLFREMLMKNTNFSLEDWFEFAEFENKSANINRAECYNVLRKLMLKPFESEYKVLIVWLPELLGADGNILLKMIEEPKEGTLILFVSEKPENVLVTIISRCQPVKIPPYSATDIQDYLRENNLATSDISGNIALMSEGNLNLATKLALNMENAWFNKYRQWLQQCYLGKMEEVFRYTDEKSFQSRDELKYFLKYALHMTRATMLQHYQDNQKILTVSENTLVRNMKTQMNMEALESMYRDINSAIYGIERHGSTKLVFNNLSLKLKNSFKQSKIANPEKK